MRTKSSRVKGSSSTRIGKRPWSSGMRSEGLATWKAPAAMKRTWSVRTIPYLVVTVEPSTMGSKSRWTPSRETSGPWVASRPAILSSSSRKMIPEFSTRWMAWLTASSTSTSFCASSWTSSRRASRTVPHARRHLGLHHVHRELGEVADHRLHVTAHVADLGVLGGLHLQERRLGQLGKPARDLGLADARGADHDDVLRRHLVPQLRRQVLPAPAISQRDGHRPLGRLLAHDVAVQLRDDLHGRQLAHGKASTVM